MKYLKVLVILLCFLQINFANTIDTRVWAVVKINYMFSSTGKIHYLPHSVGTAFFISDFYFITADHLFYDSIPFAGYTETMYALVNPNGDILGPIDILIRKSDIDMALCAVDTQGNDVFIWQCTENYKKDDNVFNLGFSRSVLDPNWYFKFSAIEPPMKLDSVYIHNTEFNGNIVGEDSTSFKMKSLTYEKKKFIILDYETPQGCSGGPVILKSSNEVIGLISFGMGVGHNIAYAVSMKEIMPYIKSFITK